MNKTANDGVASTGPRFTEDEFKTLSLEVNNIKDTDGFKRKVQGKLDELIDPKTIQIFNMKQSKQLYQVVTKHADKEKERQRKYDEKTKGFKKKSPVKNARKSTRTISRSRTSKVARFDEGSARSSIKSGNSIKRSTMRKSSRQSTMSPSRSSPNKFSATASPARSRATSKGGSPYRRAQSIKTV